jgi:hypothetical protein
VAALASPAASIIARGDLLQKCFKQPHSVTSAAVSLMISAISHAPDFLLSSSGGGGGSAQAPVPPLLALHSKTIIRLLADGGAGGGTASSSSSSSSSSASLMCAGHLICSQPLAAALGAKTIASVTAAMVACLRRLLKHDPQCARDVLLPCLSLIHENGGDSICWTEGEWSRRLGVQVTPVMQPAVSAASAETAASSHPTPPLTFPSVLDPSLPC